MCSIERKKRLKSGKSENNQIKHRLFEFKSFVYVELAFYLIAS